MGVALRPILRLVPAVGSSGHNDVNDAERVPVTPKGERRPVENEEHAALIARLERGDSAAMSALYDGTNRLVYGLCTRILGNRADAEEVTLDVYMQAWRQAARYDASRGEPVSWLLTIAHSRAIDRLRSQAGARRREQPLDEAASLPSLCDDPETGGAVSQRARVVRAALARISPGEREALELAFFEGLTHTEVAIHLGLPLGTVKSRIRLGLQRLRDNLGEGAAGWTA
jgi:RNA polymerase sigma-70 factor (ECF subfamily)